MVHRLNCLREPEGSAESLDRIDTSPLKRKFSQIYIDKMIFFNLQLNHCCNVWNAIDFASLATMENTIVRRKNRLPSDIKTPQNGESLGATPTALPRLRQRGSVPLALGGACAGRVLTPQQERSRGCPLLVGRSRHRAAVARARATPATLSRSRRMPARWALSRRWCANPRFFFEMQENGRHAPQTGAGSRRAKHRDDGRARRVHPVEIGGGL